MTKKKPFQDMDFVRKQRDDLESSATGNGAHYRIITADDKVHFADNVSCYGGFHGLGLSLPRDFVPEIMILHEPSYSKSEAVRAYIDWCVNESPYRDVFLDKDPDYIMKHPIALDMDQHPRMVIGAAILIRYRSHLTSRVSFWHQLVKKGVHPDMAFILCNIYESNSKEGFVWNMDQGGHGLWHPGACKNTIINFIDHNPKIGSETVKARKFSYTGLWNIWGTVDTYSSDKIICPQPQDEVQEKSGWGNSTRTKKLHKWENLDNFMDRFLKGNGVKKEYAKALKSYKAAA